MQIVSNFKLQDVLYGKHDKIQMLTDLVNMHTDLFDDDTIEITYEEALRKLKDYYEITD